MNTYHKFIPNVFLAKCESRHEQGQVIKVSTRYGKENDCIVWNLIFERDGFFFYSITRADGFDSQDWAKKRMERRLAQANRLDQKSTEAYHKANKHKDFLVLAEPIKIGHHSEKRHRKIIKQAQDNATKSWQLADEAKEVKRKAEYWEKRSGKIDLSMPESIEYFESLVEQMEENLRQFKSGEKPKEHSYSLSYASKDLRETKKKFELAKKLWGEPNVLAD